MFVHLFVHSFIRSFVVVCLLLFRQDRRESEDDLWDDLPGGGDAREGTAGLHGVEGAETRCFCCC